MSSNYYGTLVEQIASIMNRSRSAEDEEPEESLAVTVPPQVLPYRAGYEAQDRKTIQDALTNGTLKGVISTSALEMGIDIGSIDIVVLLSFPKSVKSFRQRIGRAGRKTSGHIIVMNNFDSEFFEAGTLDGLLGKELEPSYFYFENRYVQYVQALFTASEANQIGIQRHRREPLQDLPGPFLDYLENELDPQSAIPHDLMFFKQQAVDSPHLQFPLRAGLDRNFVLENQSYGAPPEMGDISYSQLMREAYPGAIYYYMAQPHRVLRVNFRSGLIAVKRTKRITTKPILMNLAFLPLGGVIRIQKSPAGFFMEAEIQVSERVTGYKEMSGKTATSFLYGPGNPYQQQPIVRQFATTGVLWFFPTETDSNSEDFSELLLEAFAQTCGRQTRDIGYGRFHFKANPEWLNDCSGFCMYDNVYGSLRLTKELFDRFAEILDNIIRRLAVDDIDGVNYRDVTRRVRTLVTEMDLGTLSTGGQQAQSFGGENAGAMIDVVAVNEIAIYKDAIGDEEVTVLGYRFTSHGLMARLKANDMERMVPQTRIFPVPGLSRMAVFDTDQGEYREP